MDNAITRANAPLQHIGQPLATWGAGKLKARSRTWSILLTSANHGTVGPAGAAFPHAGEHHERVQVVEIVAAGAPPAPGVDLAGLVRFGWCDIDDTDFIERPDGEYVRFSDIAEHLQPAAPVAAQAGQVAVPEDQAAEIAHLRAELEKMWKARFMVSQALHNAMVGNQSAWIEWQHGAGAEAAMAWIHNGLVGPGLIPDGKEAQPWFDAHQDDRYDVPPCPALAAAPSAPAVAQQAPADEYKPVGKFLFTGWAYEATSSDDPRGITLYRPAPSPAKESK